MSFRTKFIVVGVLVAGPLCGLAGFAAAQFHAQVRLTDGRAEALERAARARDLIEALALHRGLTATVLAGGEGLSSRLVQQQQRVEETLQRLLAAWPAHAEGHRPRQEMAREVRALMALPDAKEPLANFERHNRMIDALLVQMHRTGAHGASSNGTQLAGVYDVAFVALPALLESLGRQRGWGSAVLQQEQFSDAEIARHLMTAGAVAMRLDLLEADARTLAELDLLGHRDGGSVPQALRAALAEVEVFSQRSIAQVLSRQGGAEAALQHLAEGTTAIDRLLALSREVSDRLLARTLEQQRQAERWRALSVLALGLVLLVLALVYREFEHTTVRRLQRLKQASSRIADGEFEDSVSVEGSDEIASLADALDAMRRRLRQAVADAAQAMAAQATERSRTEFLARWSHDLRTPLSAVLGFARLMGEREAAPLSAPQQADLQRIQAAAGHLLHLVDDVLALSSDGLREGRPRRDRVDLAEVAQDAIALNGPEAERRGIRVQADLAGLPPVGADRTRVLQVLGNLVGNAVKFNHDGGWVRLRGHVDGGGVVLDVSDGGPGIAPDRRAQLFTPFERLDAGQRGIDGTGLGLATCRRLMEAMDGRIDVHGPGGEGTTLRLWLPLAPDEARAPDPAPAATGRVAYVEDNETNIELMQAMLAARTAVALTVFRDGASALASPGGFDLWIIDHRLPDTDGIALLRALRQRHGSALHAVLFTADVQPQRRVEALAAGYRDCWTKPLALDDLERSLRALLPR